MAVVRKLQVGIPRALDLVAPQRAMLGAITRRAGQWLIGAPLGRGGMAEVFAAQSAAGAPAAVKILHSGVANDPDLLARFWREVEVAAEIGHPGVVRVIDHGLADDGRPYLAMERLEGSTLADLASQSGGIAPDELLGYADQLLDVLAAAHERGVVHRDLKPANLFVTREGRLKVLDFGIARLLERGPDDLRTATGVALGTVSYMAPEQAAGLREQVDGRTDLFAVGAILFRLLSGRRVHEGRNGGEMLLMAASQQARPLGSVAPQVPVAVAAVVDRALAFDKHHRFPDASRMRAALADARVGTAEPAGPRGWAPPRAADAPTDVTVRSAGGELAAALTLAATVVATTSSSAGSVPMQQPSGTAPAPSVDRSMRRVLAGVSAAAALTTLLGLGGAYFTFVTPQASSEPSGPKAVELSEMLRAYRVDPRSARRIYGSELIRTSGVVREVRREPSGDYVQLGEKDEPWLECWLRKPSSLGVGQVITVEGRVTAWRENSRRVSLGLCAVVSATKSTASAPAPSSSSPL